VKISNKKFHFSRHQTNTPYSILNIPYVASWQVKTSLERKNNFRLSRGTAGGFLTKFETQLQTSFEPT
jgi:hypothetical protein